MSQHTPESPAPIPAPAPDPAAGRPPQRAGRPRPRSRRNTWLFIALVLVGVALTALFALRALRSFHNFREDWRRPPREAVGNIAPWMSIPYVAAVYGVPADFLFEQLGIPAERNDRKPLHVLERQYLTGDRGVIIDGVRAAVELYYAGGPTATPAVVDPGLVPPPDGPDGPDGGPGGPDGEHDDGPDAPTPLPGLAAPEAPTAPATTPEPTLSVQP